ncbi:MAG: NADH-quinone oxidoreductase subunit L [Halobacteria archaeon]|nr:NADH-quinone oxidoreductase subunit L [Halobacteria archaeon]
MAAVDYAWLIPVVPFVSFVVILVAGMAPKERGLGGLASTVIGTLAVGVSLVLSAWVFAEAWTAGVEFHQTYYTWVTGLNSLDLTLGVLIDPLSALMALIVSVVSFLVHVFSKGYMNDEGESGLPRYYTELSLFTASMLGFVVADNILMAFIFFELVGLCSYLLIGFWYERPSAASAAKKAFLVTRFGDYFFLVAVVGMFAAFGTFQFGADFGGEGFPGVAAEMMETGEPILGMSPELGVTVLGLLVLGGVIGKSAQFPLHTWLPDAMEGPTTVSALIHAATMVAAGVYLVARMFDFYALSPTALLVIAFVGGFTALFAATMGVVMDDIKRVLAYSTISQYGYMMLALGAGGYTAGVFHLMNHAFFKALLFLGAGSVIIATHHVMDMWEYGGLRKKMPVTYYTFLAGSFALAGIVPFSGFWSKDEVLTSAFQNAANQPLLWIPFVLGLIAVFFTGFYTFRMVALTFHGEPRSDYAEHASEKPDIGARETRYSVLLPLVVLGILATFVGFVNAVPLGIHQLEHFLHAEELVAIAAENAGYVESFTVSYLVTGVSLALALVGAFLGFTWYRESPRRRKEEWGTVARVVEKKYYMDHFQVWLAEGVTLRFSNMLNEFDLDVVDGIVNLVSVVSLGSGDSMRRIQSGIVSHYAAIITFGVAVLLLIIGLVGGWF